MKLREIIKKEVKTMNPDELSILYEQIRLIKKMKSKSKSKKKTDYPIDEIQDMTSSSKSNWSEIVYNERAERK